MIRKLHAERPFYEFDLFDEFADTVKHAVFTRHTDFSDASSIQTVLETKTSPASFSKQLHGTHAWIITENNLNNLATHNSEGDILITQLQGIPLLIRIADCASILIFDPVKSVIANVHAGWRGLAARVVREAVRILTQRFDCQPKNLLAGISPMLGPCCSRFTDPAKELPKFLHGYIGEENKVNLWAIVEAHLRECGIPSANIENARVCTACNPEEFFSYRGEGQSAGRFATVLMLR